ncbi:MAG: PD40 domain-containing protein [Bacteroidetes bacterium]|nr:PD40 domain-containing protein [Bacteroidota bacterium]
MNLQKHLYHLILVFILYSVTLSAQTFLPPGAYTSTNKKAIKYLEESKKYFGMRKDVEAEKMIKKAIEEDPNFVEAYSAYADFLMSKGKPALAIPNYEKALQINPKILFDNHFYLGGAYFITEQYDKAAKEFEIITTAQRVNPNTKDEASRMLKSALFAADAVKHPKPFKPINAGSGINTDLDEYFPAITADNTTFLFTRRLESPYPGPGGMKNYNEDFYESKSDGKTWLDAHPLRTVNTPGNEGAPTLSADGNYMFFASCLEADGTYGSPDRKGYGSCDIFYSAKVNGIWTKPVNIGPPINTANWETQPSFSSDGKTLYFVRGMISRTGEIKDPNIYVSTIGDDGKFGDPIKLPDNINTPRNEESVFIHPDNITLYFSSDGHPGMGMNDIFVTKKQTDGQWSEPVNLGYPINTSADENSLLVGPDGKIAYYASNKAGGFGGLDIYMFEMPEDLKPEKITYVKGKVYDAITKQPLEAVIELYDIESAQNINRSYSTKKGDFLVTLTANKNYMANVAKEGYLYYSDNFSLKNVVADYNKPFQLEIPLLPIDTGNTVELKNVFFDVNKWDLKPESKAELEKLISFLKKNANLKIELSGHTDNSGDKKFNFTLSTNRAKAVYDYVITNGKIPANRLSYKGYADTKPKVPNNSPENKAKNRRTEFKVTAK